MIRSIIYYSLIVGVFGGLIWFIMVKGEGLSSGIHVGIPSGRGAAVSAATSAGKGGQTALLLLQMAIIIVAARVSGGLARYVRQPAVVGEILAGICLGPSLMGWVWPSASAWLFPPGSLQPLYLISQLGLILFMFVVGMELDTGSIAGRARQALMISHVSILLPFLLGAVLAYHIYPLVSLQGVSFLPFALFLGTAMSITAFPVLARIVQERRLAGTELGNLAITCAAADDITAWCVLAVVVAVAQANTVKGGLLTILMALVFILLMLKLVKPALKGTMRRYIEYGKMQSAMALALVVVLAAACIAEVIGIHALFGAFITGVIFPADSRLRDALAGKLHDISLLLFLPVYFAFTGLRTRTVPFGDPTLWIVFGLILLVAIAGKFLGSSITARLMGLSRYDSLNIGILMNTRGLMELIVLNIGYEMGILSGGVFSLMVWMALITTFMTGLLLDWVDRMQHRSAERNYLRINR